LYPFKLEEYYTACSQETHLGYNNGGTLSVPKCATCIQCCSIAAPRIHTYKKPAKTGYTTVYTEQPGTNSPTYNKNCTKSTFAAG